MKNFTIFAKAFQNYRIAHEMDKAGKYPKITFPRQKLTEDIGTSGEFFIDDIETHLSQSRIFEVSENIKKLLVLTKVPAKNSMVKLPYPSIFIDVDFDRKEMEHLGIDIGYRKIIGLLIREGILVNEKDNKTVGKDLRISLFSEQDKAGEVWFDTVNVNCDLDEEYKDLSIGIKRADSCPIKTKNFVHLFVLAFLNFVNNPDVEVVVVERDDKQNAKRMSKGKYPIPERNVIQLNGILKRYVDSLESDGSFKYSYRFWVRGHFRTLRDERRWGNKVGMRIWIPPFIKGRGVLMDNIYKLEE